MFSDSLLHNRIYSFFFKTRMHRNLFLLLDERKKISMKRQSHYDNRNTQVSRTNAQLASRRLSLGRGLRVCCGVRAGGGARSYRPPTFLLRLASHFHYYVTFISFYFKSYMHPLFYCNKLMYWWGIFCKNNCIAIIVTQYYIFN